MSIDSGEHFWVSKTHFELKKPHYTIFAKEILTPQNWSNLGTKSHIVGSERQDGHNRLR